MRKREREREGVEFIIRARGEKRLFCIMSFFSLSLVGGAMLRDSDSAGVAERVFLVGVFWESARLLRMCGGIYKKLLVEEIAWRRYEFDGYLWK